MTTISRRAVLGAGLAAAAVRPGRAAAAPSGEIVLMAYSGTFQDNYTKAVVEPFMAANPGVKVIYNPGGSSAQMLGMLRAQRSHPADRRGYYGLFSLPRRQQGRPVPQVHAR